MANRHGGYRAPQDPAPVSGPGKMSKRTDGGPGDKQPIRAAAGGVYGERAAMESLQAQAPLVDTRNPPPTSPFTGAMPTPLHAPTERPNEPVTAGAPVGAGPGPEAMGFGGPNLNASAEKVKKFLPLLRQFVDNDDVPDEVRVMYRMIRDA